jgi:hypothetical protein
MDVFACFVGCHCRELVERWEGVKRDVLSQKTGLQGLFPSCAFARREFGFRPREWDGPVEQPCRSVVRCMTQILDWCFTLGLALFRFFGIARVRGFFFGPRESAYAVISIAKEASCQTSSGTVLHQSAYVNP